MSARGRSADLPHWLHRRMPSRDASPPKSVSKLAESSLRSRSTGILARFNEKAPNRMFEKVENKLEASASTTGFSRLRNVGNTIQATRLASRHRSSSSDLKSNLASMSTGGMIQNLDKTDRDLKIRKAIDITLATSSRNNAIDVLCKRLDKKLKDHLPTKSKNWRQFYTVVKPFEFLTHQNTKIDLLQKQEISSRYSFTKKADCPPQRESASTKKLMANLRALGSKVQTCKIE